MPWRVSEWTQFSLGGFRGRTRRRNKNGAGHGDRTRDIQLGKLALYQLS